MKQLPRRVSFAFLCVAPFLAVALTAVRALRVSGLYQSLGAMHFVLLCLAAFTLGRWALKADSPIRRHLALSGALFLTPTALLSLLWVGLGTPWEATPVENRMRYLVLLAGAIAVTSAFIVLKEALREAGERLYTTVGFAANILAGAGYLVWLTLHVGVYDVKVRDGQVPPAIGSLANIFDTLLFAACVLTYFAAAAYAAAMGRVQWLARGASRAIVAANLVLMLFIVLRGLSFPDPTASSMPWYALPGFIAGIPAVPWIMPFLIGVVLIRRAGDESS